MTTHDYSQFEQETPRSDTLLKRLSQLAKDQVAAETLIANLEAQMIEAKAALRFITDDKIPTTLDELGLEDFTTTDGIKVEVKEKLRGSIPKGKEGPAFKWLDDHDQGNLIKRQFMIEFGKGDEGWANKFEGDLKKRKKPLNVARKMAVHPSTLQAFIKSQLEAGVDIPLDVFGVYRQRSSKVTIKGT